MKLSESDPIGRRVVVEIGQRLAELQDAGLAGPEADAEASRQLFRLRERYFPDDSVLCEDRAPSLAGPVLWIVDPLDGTTNYASRLPWYAVSVSCVDTRSSLALYSATYAPAIDWLFEANGRGAFLNGMRIAVRSRAAIDDWIVLYGMRAGPGDCIDESRRLETVTSHVRGTRRSGCATLDLCLVASGRADAYMHSSLRVWDFAAGAHLIRTAGGAVFPAVRRGSPLTIGTRQILATGGCCPEGWLELLVSAPWPVDERESTTTASATAALGGLRI